MAIKSYLISALVCTSLLFPASAQAQDGQPEPGPLTYQFHLNFTGGRLTPIVKEFDVLPYEFISDEFVDKPGLYYGKVFSMKNEPLEDFHYDLLDGNNEVLAPYFPEAKTVAFYKSNVDKEPLLAVSVSKTALCNQDNICQQEAGETENNCRADCGISTPGNANNSNPVANNDAGKTVAEKYYNILIIGLVILGIATLVVFVIMFIRRNRNQ